MLPLAPRRLTHAADGGRIVAMMTEAATRPAEQAPGNRGIAEANAGRYPAMEAQLMSGNPNRDPFDVFTGRGPELMRR
ncbi:hypothetical protein [uncultured Paracoccus sp.]|uniref:hypothetical protein n=1 Tax=uncultured Paracoccus sp. TaxID=189685 RepID=UPI00259A9449|nr:hypothetical protein [uncultured Paracoccus sp.]